MIGIIVFIPFFLSARQSFLDYQNGTTQLRHYLDRQTIAEAQIIAGTDTILVEQLEDYYETLVLQSINADLGSMLKELNYYLIGQTEVKIAYLQTDKCLVHIMENISLQTKMLLSNI
ncbi:MAG: hypothetical protein M3421_14960 [Bacteroidota bacterium]|nr:hypothetical protein [Bacteroidota bacterium]